MKDQGSLNKELLKQMAHIQLGHSTQAIPFEANLGDKGLSLAIAGNYLSYATLIEGKEKLFITSWFPQLARFPKDMSNLGQTLIAQNLMMAGSSFSMQQEFLAEEMANRMKNESSGYLERIHSSQQWLEVIETIRK